MDLLGILTEQSTNVPVAALLHRLSPTRVPSGHSTQLSAHTFYQVCGNQRSLAKAEVCFRRASLSRKVPHQREQRYKPKATRHTAIQFLFCDSASPSLLRFRITGRSQFVTRTHVCQPINVRIHTQYTFDTGEWRTFAGTRVRTNNGACAKSLLTLSVQRSP